MIVLLVAYVLTNKVYADSANTLAMAQKETSKIKTQLDEKEKSLKTQEIIFILNWHKHQKNNKISRQI